MDALQKYYMVETKKNLSKKIKNKGGLETEKIEDKIEDKIEQSVKNIKIFLENTFGVIVMGNVMSEDERTKNGYTVKLGPRIGIEWLQIMDELYKSYEWKNAKKKQ